MPQRLDRVELCRTAGGDVAEDDADGGGEGEGEQVDAGAEQEGQRQQVRQAVTGDEGEQQADQSAERGQYHRFSEELHQHFFFQRADGEADADFARALGYGHQHDVHDADAADQQADGGDRAEQGGHGADGAGEGFGDFLGVQHIEVVVLVVRQFAPLAHQQFDLAAHLFGRRAVLHGDQDGADFLFAGQPPLHGAQWHDHGVVLVAPHRALSLGGEHADHFARELFDAQGFADRAVRVEQFTAHGGTDDAHGLAGAFFAGAEEAACGQFPVAGGEIIGGAAGDGGGPVAAADHHHHALAGGRRDGVQRADLDFYRFRIFGLERGRAGEAVGHALAGTQHQQVAAEAADLVRHGLRRAVAQRDHGDHGADADDDAEHGEERAHQVAPDLSQGEQQCGPAHHAAPPFASSRAIWPSTKCTVRWA